MRLREVFLPMTSTTTSPAEFSMQRTHTSDRTGAARWVWSHARRHGWIITMLVAGAVGNAALAAVVPVLTGNAFNAMLKQVPDTSVLLPLALTIGISQILRGVLQLQNRKKLAPALFYQEAMREGTHEELL